MPYIFVYKEGIFTIHSFVISTSNSNACQMTMPKGLSYLLLCRKNALLSSALTNTTECNRNSYSYSLYQSYTIRDHLLFRSYNLHSQFMSFYVCKRYINKTVIQFKWWTRQIVLTTEAIGAFCSCGWNLTKIKTFPALKRPKLLNF